MEGFMARFNDPRSAEGEFSPSDITSMTFDVDGEEKTIDLDSPESS